MPTKKKHVLVKKSLAAPRASVSFPPALYHILEEIAKKKKVSVAWVVRDAAEKYVTELYPLFEGDKSL